MDKKWIIKKIPDATLAKDLAEELQVEVSLSNLLMQRGIRSKDDARTFFKPDLADLHDPFLMADMNNAVDRIGSAIARNEKILVYGDYDVDGTTSVAMIYSFFKERYQNIGYYIPDRYKEGYGVSLEGIDYASENNYNLIIALDCGIKAVDKIKYASSKQIDFIVCDHHLPAETIPDAVAVLDPKREGCSYPYKELSGCGVGFKLLQAYSRINGIPFDELIPYLDLVAVSIASDIVPVTGENRILAHFGLIQLNTNPRIGLKSIIKISGMSGKQIGIEDIIYKIGPRINAAGRIESGEKAVDLLTSLDERDAVEMSSKIDDFNQTRRNIDRSITQEALQMISSDPRLNNSKSTVLYNPNWHKGVIGIVASRLTETYYRPTVILTESNGFATGSARSVLGYDLYQAIDACGDLLENFGGHMYAAGLTLKKENIELFQERFEKVVSETITDDQLIPKVEIDTQIDFSDISENFYNTLKQFQPFGPGNMAPVFMSSSVFDNGSGRLVGSSSEHLKLELLQKEAPYHQFPAIGFSMVEHFSLIRDGKPFDICYSIEENEFRGNITLQLNLKDIKEG